MRKAGRARRGRQAKRGKRAGRQGGSGRRCKRASRWSGKKTFLGREAGRQALRWGEQTGRGGHDGA